LPYILMTRQQSGIVTGQDRFLPHPFQFIIHWTSYNPELLISSVMNQICQATGEFACTFYTFRIT
jgi:hypothetical protein